MRVLKSARGVWKEEGKLPFVLVTKPPLEVAFKLGFADPLSLKFSFRSIQFSSFLKVT